MGTRGGRRLPVRLRLVSLVISLVVVSGLLLVVACGIEEYYTGMGEGALPGEPLNPQAPAVNCNLDVVCGCQGGVVVPAGDATQVEITIDVADLSGFVYRFDSLALTAPLPDNLADQVNKFFADEIAAGTLNILFAVRADDRDARRLVADLGPGAASGEGHAFSETPSELVCGLAGAGFTTTAPATLAFPNDLLVPPRLPLREVELSGTFSSGAEAITGGALDAALTVGDAAEMRVIGVPFKDMLEGLGIYPDLDRDEDGTNDAWRFRGEFTAERTALVE